MLLLDVATIGCPIVTALAWWRWFRPQDPVEPHWRRTLLLIALVSVTANAVVYYGWLSYYMGSGRSEQAWALNPRISAVMLYPILAGAVGALAGKGNARLSTGVSAVFGFLLWVNPGIL